MYVETYPTAVKAGPLGDLVYENNKKSTLNFLFIGKNDGSLYYFSSFFKSGNFVDGFSQARREFDSLLFHNRALPDSIIIDVPLQKQQLEAFCSFLKERPGLASIPVIYNAARLDAEKIKMVQNLDMIDDVVNINSWEINFSQKISFLKKMKSQHRRPYLTKAVTNGFDSASVKDIFNMKRAFDIVIAAILLILLSPVLLIIALAVRLESKGPIMYAAPRAGRGFKIFKFYKFRTMEVDADKKIESLAHLNQYDNTTQNGAKFLKICNDPRVTKVGKFLRNSSLDELPQLFNVLKGDMSLVGNRPLPIYEATTLTTNDCVERFMAPAGITGLWQIKKRGKSEMSVEERIDLDIVYARKYSLLMDMWIIAKTPVALFQKSDV